MSTVVKSVFPFLRPYAENAQRAYNKLKELPSVKQTDLVHAFKLSKFLGVDVWIKCEHQQSTGAFKIRGATYAISQLTDAQKKAGVITASAGNHAQGAAYAAYEQRINATIVVPQTTPEAKIEGIQRWNPDATIIRFGENFDEALAEARRLEQENGQTFIHPFDDDDVIAGQGTVAIESIEQFRQQNPDKKIEAIFVPVGGGGLLAGVSAVVQTYYPGIKVVGVEPEKSDCLHQALKAGEPVRLIETGPLADGLAVKIVGTRPFQILKNILKKTLRVKDDLICAAAVFINYDTGKFPEAAGATATAGMIKYAQELLRRKPREEIGALIAVASGGNVDAARMGFMISRDAFGKKTILRLVVGVPETPGSLHAFSKELADYNITKLKYRYSGTNAHFLVDLEVGNSDMEFKAIAQKIRAIGFTVRNLTRSSADNDNSVVSQIGGHPPHHINETPYRLEFLEQRSALLNFLSDMPKDWNLTAFDYDNDGNPTAQIELALQTPPQDCPLLKQFMAKYKGVDISNSVGYQAFRRPTNEETKNAHAARHHSR